MQDGAIYVQHADKEQADPVTTTSSYARGMMWKLLPCAPGLAPAEALRRLTGLPKPGEHMVFAVALVLTLFVVAVLAALIRRGSGMRFASLLVAAAVSGASAFSLLSALRS